MSLRAMVAGPVLVAVGIAAFSARAIRAEEAPSATAAAQVVTVTCASVAGDRQHWW